MNRMMIMALCLVLASVSCTTAVGENKTGEFVTSVKGGKKIKKKSRKRPAAVLLPLAEARRRALP